MWLIRETQNQSYIELISAISACFSPTTTNWIDTNKKLDDINLILCYKVTCTISIQQWSSFAVNSIYEPSLLIWSISLKNMRNKESRHKKQEESNWKVFQDHLTVWHSHQLQTSVLSVRNMKTKLESENVKHSCITKQNFPTHH